MKPNKKLVIITNEKISINNGDFFCDNIDIKSITEGLSENFDVIVISKKTDLNGSHKINLKEIILSSNMFNFLLNIFKTFKNKETNYLLISITPYTFFGYLVSFIFKKKIFVYLRSNGYEEYKAILGSIGLLIYHLMYVTVTFRSNIITCQKKLAKKKESSLVFPSELDINWKKNTTKPPLSKPKLLYVGRIKVEKGIFSLFEIFNKINSDIELSIVGKPKTLKLENDKISYLGYINNADKLIRIYDDHNILILPSFTEAYGKVIDESLSRMRPVIIFEEISHIIQNRYGIFVSQRDPQSLLTTIQFIMQQYLDIQNDISKNKLPNKYDFISQMTKILT